VDAPPDAVQAIRNEYSSFSSGTASELAVGEDIVSNPTPLNNSRGPLHPPTIDLDAFLNTQGEAISRRRASITAIRRDRRMKFGRANSKYAARGQEMMDHLDRRRSGRPERDAAIHSPLERRLPVSRRRVWMDYLSSLPEDFFSSRKALSESQEQTTRGTPMFTGLRVDEVNSADMERVYHLGFEAKIRLGQSRGTYDQMRSAAGQYLRAYLTYYPGKIEDVHQPGELFAAVSDLQLIRAFLGQFEVRASATTVMGKAMHLRHVTDHAVSYFTEKCNEEMKGKCLAAASYLRSLTSSYKTESRRFYRTRNTMNDRMERGALLLKSDFERGLGMAKDAMDSVIAFERRLHAEGHASSSVQNMIIQRPGLSEKWCINLLAALVLSGGGQRPQAYALLELPTPSELERDSQRCRSGEQLYFSLLSGREKTTRSMDLPRVLFPRTMLPYVQFHVRTMRPLILRCLNSCLQNSEDRDTMDVDRVSTLLVDTRDGLSLRSTDVTSTFRKFIAKMDPELAKNITPMAIRGSYASMMLQSRRRGEVFVEMSEQQFLQFLAHQMNTSIEQLASTYASCDVDGFEDVANKLMRFFENESPDVGDAPENAYEDTIVERSSLINSFWS
jgi:hypothetical protein